MKEMGGIASYKKPTKMQRKWQQTNRLRKGKWFMSFVH